MKNLIRKQKSRRKGRKGQTALEYALVIGAITLVIMASWNLVGQRVQQAISGKLLEDIEENLVQGNATITQ